MLMPRYSQRLFGMSIPWLFPHFLSVASMTAPCLTLIKMLKHSINILTAISIIAGACASNPISSCYVPCAPSAHDGLVRRAHILGRSRPGHPPPESVRNRSETRAESGHLAAKPDKRSVRAHEIVSRCLLDGLMRNSFRPHFSLPACDRYNPLSRAISPYFAVSDR